jgi:glycosyltransferase involved in cell wall biosynthesis
VKASDPEPRSPRNLLLIAYAFPPNPAPGSARAWRFYKYLPEFGYNVHVITASPAEHVRPNVEWVPLPERGLREKVLRRVFFPVDDDISWAQPALRAAKQMMANTRIDAVLSTVPFIHDHLIALVLKRDFGIPWIADYRDPVVGNPFRPTTGVPGMVDRFLDARFFAHADLLIAVTDRVQREWIERCPEVAGKTAVLWNGYDPEENIEPRPLPERSFRLIAHFGNFYGSRTPVPVLESCLRLIKRGALEPWTIRFRFVGGIDARIIASHNDLFERLIVSGCLELFPPVPRPQALEQLMQADSLLLADNNQASMGHTVPAKLYEYIRVRRPVLALTVNGSPVEQILGMSGVRFVTMSQQFDPSENDRRLLEFLSLPTEPVSLSEQFLNEFNGRNQAHTLAGMLDRIIGGPTDNGASTDDSSEHMAEVQR